MNDELKNISRLFEKGIEEVFDKEKSTDTMTLTMEKKKSVFWDFIRHRVVNTRFFWKKP